ncbi:hypothetical protein [Streptomyces sp. NPDC048191]|uniref:hypothetical protein n=1 Tax=Streptomyces sp. NPDC048191 TaxID=3155484 RepID=UPI0033F93DBE
MNTQDVFVDFDVYIEFAEISADAGADHVVAENAMSMADCSPPCTVRAMGA